ncbi:MAG: LysM peptidoglycan-binding domain-containing protein, partial [Inquilinus sp.]|nr:LysM peptidoglycan-binding domain-containing protein [Inquilinus sp.]
ATPTPPAAGRATSGSAAIVQRPSPPAAADGQQALLPPMRPPTFAVVRVNEYGDAVIAGRAEPRAIVIIYDGEEEIGRVAADGRGDWVFVSDRPLSPGQHELGLVAQIGGQQRMSDQVVVLIAPEPRRDIAGRDSEADEEREKPLALLIPRDEIGATRVLQAPAAGPAPGAPDTPTPPSGTDAESPPVSIDVVDYDEEGQLIVSGRSAPDSAVRLYLDNQLVGEAQADASGVFQVQPTEPVAPGVHAMRVDEVDTGGAVTARAETPFERPLEIVEAPPGYSRVIVQPGNSLWRLARRVYGHGIQYTVIYQANFGQIRDPDLIYPGQVFNLPEVPRSVPGGDPS